MDFVAIDTGIAGDRITHILVDRLRIRIPEAVGILTLVFAEMTQHAEDGDLSHTLDTQLEEWARWHGKRGALAPVLRELLCDADGVVRAWDRWNGAKIRKAKAERERLRQWREDRQRERDAAAQAERDAYSSRTRTRTSTRTGTETVRVGVTVPDLTGQDRTKLPTTTPTTADASPTARGAGEGKAGAVAPPAATWITPFAQCWERHYGDGSFDVGPALKPLAALRKRWPDAEILRRLDWYLENRGSEVVLAPDQLARLRFTPHIRDFRGRFGRFDPSAPSDHGEAA